MSNSGFNVTWDGKDLTELKKSVKALGDVPQKCVTSAAGKAATLTKRAIKAGDVPVRTGAMKRGIIRTKKERSRVKGKAVYRIDFKGGDEANSVFQKTVKDPGAAGSTQTTPTIPTAWSSATSPGMGTSYLATISCGMGPRRAGRLRRPRWSRR